MKLGEYVQYDATGLGELVNSGEVTAAELTRLAREAHDRVNSRLNAVIEFYDDAETVAGADSGHFNGVPFLRKDIGPTEAGRLQEMGSRLLKGRRAKRDSHYTRRARAAGLRTLGRTTTPEFGISGFSESLLNGVTGNPWNLLRTAGGSSAGSAAAVAAGIVPIAGGGDGGGSIRTPAAWCGLVGLNPSRGRISGGPDRQDPSLGLSRSFVLCRSVRDMAAALDALSGPAPGDPFIIVQPIRPYVDELTQPTGRLRVGVARSKWADHDVEPETISAVERTAKALEDMGHIVEDIGPPLRAADYSAILLGNADLRSASLDIMAQDMGRELGPDTLEPVNLRLYEHGRIQPLARASQVLEAIRRMRADVAAKINPYDILLTPVQPEPAPPHGGALCATSSDLSAEQWMDADAAMYQYLGVFNVTGQPSVSLPLAQSGEGLPIGVQIVGQFGDEATLVRIARDLENAMPWSDRRPPVHVANSL